MGPPVTQSSNSTVCTTGMPVPEAMLPTQPKFPEAMTSFKANDVQMIALLVGNPDLARQIREGEVKGLLLPGSTRWGKMTTWKDRCSARK